MATRSVNGLLTSVDSLFTTQQERDEANLKKIYDIPISEIDDFPEHPYQVNDDEDMDRLVESIKERGIITPATVRKKDDGRYELISGHRRKRACELAGLESLRCDIVDLTRDEAIVLMVESNYQRSNILPSEKAFAYKMRLDAMNRQGKRNDLTSDPVGTKLRSNQEFAIESGDSTSQIHRYIRLTNLVPELLEYATACAEVDTWNKLGRWVNRGTKGIALIVNRNTPYKLRHVFDISDTNSLYGHTVEVWQMKPHYEEAVRDALENSFGESDAKNFMSFLVETARNAVEDNYTDYLEELLDSRRDSFLEELDEFNVDVWYCGT